MTKKVITAPAEPILKGERNSSQASSGKASLIDKEGVEGLMTIRTFFSVDGS